MTNSKFLPVFCFLFFIGSSTSLNATELVRMCNFHFSSAPGSGSSCSSNDGVTYFGGSNCSNEPTIRFYLANLEKNGQPTNTNGVYLLPCLLYTSPSPRDATLSRMPSSA